MGSIEVITPDSEQACSSLLLATAGDVTVRIFRSTHW